MSSAAFEDLGVLPEIIKAVDEQGWTLPTSVQAESIPLILGGGDVMAVKINLLRFTLLYFALVFISFLA